MSVVPHRASLLLQGPFGVAASLSRPLPCLASNNVRRFSAAPSPQEASLVRAGGGLTFLELNRPAAKNALSVGLVDSLRSLVEEVRFDGSTRALILRSGVAGAFCAGADLKERKGMTQLEVARFLYNLRRLLGELQDLPVPTIAAIDGPALGGGLELALACDFRVAGASVTKLGLPETRLAIIPGCAHTARPSADIVLLGCTVDPSEQSRRVLNAYEALELGIVNHVSAQGQTASEKAEEVIGEMLQAGPLALRAAKVAIDVGIEADLESGLNVERLAYQTILQTEDRLEGLRAFVEKRKPVYQGR